MKTHCRCSKCRHRKKLARNPDEYRNKVNCHRCGERNELDRSACVECSVILSLAPKCENCRSRLWAKDSYRHRVELEQMRKGLGRYRVCHSDCYPHEHRMGFGNCKFLVTGEYKDFLQ